MAIEVRHLHKRFGAFTALDDVSLAFPPGQLTALLGPSGCGKTTLLRIIAGLAHQDEGAVLLDGLDASRLDVRERQVGFVFQHYALFRHMTVFENVAFGLRVKPRGQRPAAAEIRRRVMDLLEKVQLASFAERYPAQLSGGQRQRIALARALAVEPRVLLLDEPFGALDAKVRKELRRWLRSLHDELHLTSIFVTHDQEEALELADRIVVMHNGRVEQAGTPADVYDNPATPFVAGFLGDVNVFDGLPGGAHGYVRPHDIEVGPASAAGAGQLARLRRAHAVGPLAQLELERSHDGKLIEAVVPAERLAQLGLRQGDLLSVRPRRTHVFGAQASAREAA